ncbi:hypothetical protein C8F04DRAFT_1235211 [Mycena alexandri]|uniref:Uncharacterized protein n=1 Tax=Mycena alexandri TaxID=1745969 RepID=A0AAD6X2M9_9AGAR|nr:hypothetical protein C8F04DRAFT_1235211 [Mycena alexandri]
MSYIVDLTLVMDNLFLVLLSRKLPRRLTAEDIDLALENYQNSDAAAVHTEIRKYAKNSTFKKICRSNNAEKKLAELIKKHCAKYPFQPAWKNHILERILRPTRNWAKYSNHILPRLAVLAGHEHKAPHIAVIPYDNIFDLHKPDLTKTSSSKRTSSPSPPTRSPSRALSPNTASPSTYCIRLCRLRTRLAPAPAPRPFACRPRRQAERGSRVQREQGGEIAWLKRKQAVIESTASVLIVGGGALGIQFAADIAAVYPAKLVTSSTRARASSRASTVLCIRRSYKSSMNVKVILGGGSTSPARRRGTRSQACAPTPSRALDARTVDGTTELAGVKWVSSRPRPVSTNHTAPAPAPSCTIPTSGDSRAAGVEAEPTSSQPLWPCSMWTPARMRPPRLHPAAQRAGADTLPTHTVQNPPTLDVHPTTPHHDHALLRPRPRRAALGRTTHIDIPNPRP